ncbi:MAG: hypothetical protein DME59_10370, partial [Verrucomicrobia bacterium]
MPFQQTTDLVENRALKKWRFEELIMPEEIHNLLGWSDWGPRLPRHCRFLRSQITWLGLTAISPLRKVEGLAATSSRSRGGNRRNAGRA